MAQAKGSYSQIVFQFESTYGADPGSPAGALLPFNSFGLRSDRNQIVPATITSTRNPVMAIEGNMDCKGPAVVPVDAINFGFWLKALLGAPTEGGGGGPTYVHTYKVPTAVPSMVLEAGFLDIPYYLKFNGVKVNSMSINFGEDAELVANLDLIAAKETGSATPFDASVAMQTFSRFTMAQLIIAEGGSTSSIIGTANMTIKNNLDGNSFVIGGGGVRGDLPEGVVEVSGNIKAMFTSSTLYAKAVASTESSLKITATNGTNVLEFFVPELHYKQSGIPIETPGGIWADLNFLGYYENNADSTAFKVTLTNGFATYA